MAREKSKSRNDLSMAYRIDALPRRMRPVAVLRELLAGIDNDGELPEGIEVTWRWQNAPDQDWREADFGTAVSESRPGFHTLMRRRLTRDLARAEEAAELRKLRRRQ